MQANQQPNQALLQLHLGCGTAHRQGWINVDVNSKVGPDLVASAESLPMLDPDSCSAIESCHLFEYLTLKQAREALREWRRLLVPGGELSLVLPNLARGFELIGTQIEDRDIGLCSIFGHTNTADELGDSPTHKWGWTPESLTLELRAAGFENVQQASVAMDGEANPVMECDMMITAAMPQQTPAAAATQEQPKQERTNILAWPCYTDASALDEFMGAFARVLSGRDDVCLHLRVDPQLDPSQEEVMLALEASHGRMLGTSTALNVALLEGPLTQEEWKEAASHMVCRIQSGTAAARTNEITSLALAIATDAAGLIEQVNSGRVAAASTLPPAQSEESATQPESGVLIPAGVQPEGAILERITELHPWLYPVSIDGMIVKPGLGSACDTDSLSRRTASRATFLIEEVLKRVDFRGKSVLDLACNCGFWSSYYALAGAGRLLGVEGRARHVSQAELYWERNDFLPKGQYKFLEGNIVEQATWEAIGSRGAVDVTLCAGILSQLENYAQVLGWAAQLTKEVMIIDTRVQDGAEISTSADADTGFNDVTEGGRRTVPDRKRLLQTLRDLGFNPEVLPVGFGREAGVDDADSYSEGTRITIVARKVPVPTSLATTKSVAPANQTNPVL
ncbi:MAG: hypothetical protein ACI9F9_001768 [Candidatus Paceibacteria bacterium]|jgi:hypothetical protein